ncbi:hypothetical protein [Actinoplanes couchii]|uniref:Uncharacterized protein n=1 Tax=Actinoplanes couchii TaxID=403638 RepID=A0ABQ3XFA6_9ACTN|nr:hypothetical protein [Actinoplanes couchii]MDR6321859.1 hypothetical protein [Actinoplanes couchii]GID57185.1 hypothetical protein Aco03nite_055890 [Actinoplanes couchii]
MTTYVTAGFVTGPRWVPPEKYGSRGRLPAEVATVSECLVDFVSPVRDWWLEPWFESVGEAREHPGHILSMSVPADQAAALTELMTGWIGDRPHPMIGNLARGAPAPDGSELGFEVLGFEAGRFHTWLCYSLLDETDVQPNGNGLIGTLAEAQGVADLISEEGFGPEEVTWFPARIAEH